MLLKIAWRNIWRSPVRSWIIILALTAGMFAGIFSSTFMNGWMKQRLRDGVETETGHLQVFRNEYRNSRELSLLLTSAESTRIRSLPMVEAASERIIVQGMAASAETARGIKILGIDPLMEKNVLNLYEKVREGSWFDSPYSKEAVVGEKLARQLKIDLHSRIILRFQDLEGTLTGGAFRVAGIFRTSNTAFDGTHVLVRKSDLAQLTNIPSAKCHAIVVKLRDAEEAMQTAPEIENNLKDTDAVPWKELSPELGYITELSNTYMYIFVVIILMALAFGIVNTMLMAVLERTREIGMLMSVGMARARIFAMIVLETVMLCTTGGLLGIGTGLLTVWHLSTIGIDLSIWATGLTEMGFDPIVYPEWNAVLVLNIAIMVILSGILASIYPAWKALKLNPSEAVRGI
ncbi:ABC transporter permease [Marinilabilia salmonicolor]|uniref:ABC transporter permease n=1 Tax=Marinilabilia salmonicolor TaxID=989 RepID=UPI00029B56BF|nr:FtsX-like permease family protein [Marinilabilia salmonicolor]